MTSISYKSKIGYEDIEWGLSTDTFPRKTSTGGIINIHKIPHLFTPWIDVRDYGAVGDGVTDDTAAIQAAIDSGISGRIIFPDGTYKISSTLTVASDSIFLIGSGRNKTVLIWAGDTISPMIKFSPCRYGAVKSMKLTANPTTYPCLAGIQFNQTSGTTDQLLFDDLLIEGGSVSSYGFTYGIYVTGTANCDSIIYNRVFITHCQYGWYSENLQCRLNLWLAPCIMTNDYGIYWGSTGYGAMTLIEPYFAASIYEDIYVGTPGGDGLNIIGGCSENSNRLLVTGSYDMPLPTTIQGFRFSGGKINADGEFIQYKTIGNISLTNCYIYKSIAPVYPILALEGSRAVVLGGLWEAATDYPPITIIGTGSGYIFSQVKRLHSGIFYDWFTNVDTLTDYPTIIEDYFSDETNAEFDADGLSIYGYHLDSSNYWKAYLNTAQEVLSGAELISNGDMEIGDPPTGWSAYPPAPNPGPSVFEQSGVQKHGGNFSIHIVDGNNVYGGGLSDPFSVTLGYQYKLSFWYYIVSGTVRATFYDGDGVTPIGNIDFSTVGAWTKGEIVASALQSGNSACLILRNYTLGGEIYIDDVSIQELINTIAIEGKSLGSVSPNIDIALIPGGTGELKFGTYATSTNTPDNGYITIKDAGGTERNLAVIADGDVISKTSIKALDDDTTVLHSWGGGKLHSTIGDSPDALGLIYNR